MSSEGLVVMGPSSLLPFGEHNVSLLGVWGPAAMVRHALGLRDDGSHHARLYEHQGTCKTFIVI